MFGLSAAPALLDHFGRSVQYRPGGGSPITVIADVGDISTSETEGRSGRIKERRRTITVHRDPASRYGGVEDPALNGIFEIDGEQWQIRSKKLDATFAEVEAVLIGAIQVSVPGYQPQRV